jgi:phage terminase large subunit GpA-like protein
VSLPSSREGLAALDKAILDALVLLRPPEKLSCSEWADKYFVLSPEGSARPGKWYTGNAEYQRDPLDACSDPRIQTVVLAWASQVGKTAILLIFEGYYMQHDPSPMLSVWPTEDLAKTMVQDRINPMIRDTPVLKALFGSRRGDAGDLFHKSFPGGHLSIGWTNSPSQVAARPVRIASSDEEDRMAPNAEGDPIDQLRKRMNTFGNRVHFRCSSPGLSRTSRIMRAFGESDMRRFFVPCPHCGEFQLLRFQRLSLDPDNGEAIYACDPNGCVIEEHDKPEMVRKGEWRADAPFGGRDGKTAGFHLNALYSTLGYTWKDILSDYGKCEGIPDKLQVFTNTVLAEPWDEQAEGADLNEVAKHAEDYATPAPAWCVLVTCGADVQKNRIEATKWGWGEHDVSGVIEHRVFHGDPAEPAVWRDFDAWRRQRVQHASGLNLPVAATFVDSGDGNRTQAVYAYTRGKLSQRVFACKGSSQTGAPLVNRGNHVGPYRTLVVSVGTSTAKDIIFARLKIDDPTRPGFIHFPKNESAGCDKEFYAHLTAEKLVTRRTKGGETSQWVKQRNRNEALDNAVYALAAKEFLKLNLRDLARRMEKRAAELRAAGQLPAPAPASPPTSPNATAPKSSPSPASSAPSNLPPNPPPNVQHKNAILLPKKRRKIIRRPGFGWIHQN